MAKVTKIPVIPKPKKKPRVAAYARVSVDDEGTENSLEAQIAHYDTLIRETPDWDYVKVYVDKGITGTSTRRREGFKEMIADAENGLIDIILVKSISRFARNTVDAIENVRHLRCLGVDVRFEREKIYTLTAEGEFLLTILSAFAQAESESISQNIKWAIAKNFEQGNQNGYKEPFGYRWDGQMYRRMPKEAQVVKKIFNLYLSGKGSVEIAKAVGMYDGTVRYILKNKAYAGVQVLQKDYIENHKRKTNKGEKMRYEVTGVFEPIITLEEYEKAKEIMAERSNGPYTPTVFTGKVRCGLCGGAVARRSPKTGKKYVCCNKERKHTCKLRDISEDELLNMMPERFKTVTIYDDKVVFDKTEVKRTYDGRMSPFSGRIICGYCSGKMQSDTWVGKKLYICKKCHKKISREELEKATEETVGGEEGFLREVEKVTVKDRILTYYIKEGKKTWRRPSHK